MARLADARPIVARYRSLIEKEVEADTRKLESFEDFKKATADAPPEPQPAQPPEGGRPGATRRACERSRHSGGLTY
jgi:hypothetical protein